MRKSIAIICLVLGSLSPLAQENDNRWFRWSLGFFVNSQRIHRGAVFYPAPAAFAGPSFTFFNQLSLRGPNLIWSRSKREDKFQWQLGVRLINDGAPFLGFSSSFDEDTDYRASRGDSVEFYGEFRYRFGFRDLFQLGVEVAKDINTHEGNYAALFFSVPVIKYMSLRATSGFGSLEHNRFVYGTSAVSGYGHQNLSLNYVLPKLPWRGIIFFIFEQSWVQRQENRSANLVRGLHDHFAASTRWLWFF